MFTLFSFRYNFVKIMQTPLAPHNTSFASLMKCIGLYITYLIRSVITDKDTGKCNNT